MSEQQTCRNCGAKLSKGVAGGLCRKCILLEGVNSGDSPVSQDMTAPLDQPDESQGSQIDRYRLLEKIGEGGMAVVYMAEQKQPVRRKVALKIIKLGMDTRQVIARFEAERQALAMMDHPHIAKVFDAGTTKTGRPYFVMELVRGVAITEYCDDKKLNTEKRLDLFLQVCQAVQHAHQKGIIHRDLKPSNILVTLHEGKPAAVVIDFGIAKATSQQLTEKTLFTQYAQLIGTPEYMSPEQAEMSRADVDTRTDIYALGVLLYELLTGTTPFDSKTLREAGYIEMQRIIREQEPEKPSTRLSRLSSESPGDAKLATRHAPLATDLDWIVMKCMDKDRNRRYETANGVAVDLEHFLCHEPVSAAAPSAAYHLQNFAKRHRTALATAIAFVFVLIVATILSIWQGYVATREKQRAVASEARAHRERQRALESEAEARSLHYAGAMLALESGWQASDLSRATRLLEETKAYPGRGFEWRYWWRRMHGEIKTFRGHGNHLRDVAFSPDGRWLVTGGDGGTARVWDVLTGRERLSLPHVSGTRTVAFSPDGKRILASSGEKGGATIWDASSGTRLVAISPHDGPDSKIHSTCFSPDGSRVVCGESQGVVRVCDANTGEELFSMERRHGGKPGVFVMSVAHSRDGKIASAAWGGNDPATQVMVWDAADGSLLNALPHPQSVGRVAFSPDGSRLASGSWDKRARIWDLSDPEQPALVLEHLAPVLGVAFSPNGKTLVTAAFDQTARLWHTRTGRQLGDPIRGHTNGLSAARFSPDGHTLVTASWDHTAKLWDVDAARDSLTMALGPEAEEISIGPDGSIIVFGKDLERTDTPTEVGIVRNFPYADANQITHLTCSADGQWIVTGEQDGRVKVWDAQTGLPLQTLPHHSAAITAIAVASDNLRLVIGCRDGSVRIWDKKTLEPMDTSHDEAITALAISPDGRWFVVACHDGTVSMRSMTTGDMLRPLVLRQGAFPQALSISPDGNRIAVAGGLGPSTIWDANSGEPLVDLPGLGTTVFAIRFVAGGKRILTGDWGNTVRLWETSTGHELLALRTPAPPGTKPEAHRAIYMSPDGARILSVSNHKKIRVWRAATDEQIAEWERQEAMAKGSQ